jgi:membrane-bound lytic murein transglycosylase F
MISPGYCRINFYRMKQVLHAFFRIVFLMLSLVLFTTCHGSSDETTVKGLDLEQIRKRGKLVAVTDYSPMNYFIYRGQPLGYQYELLQEFANTIGMEIELVVSRDLDNTVKMLRSGQADIIALNFTVTNERKKLVDFTIPHSQSRQVLVQRIPGITGPAGDIQPAPKLIRDHFELASPEVEIVVQKNSATCKRMKHLAEEMGDSINVKEYPVDDEELVEMVATGEIDYTVCDENVALVCKTYYPNIDCETPISFTQNLAWAVRKDSPVLLEELNKWLGSFKKTASYAVIYNKYFRNPRVSEMMSSDYFVSKTGRISAYDELIKKYSEKINWDWTLLASVVYQESHFNPDARSWAGAYGLMQLMPSVLTQFGNNSPGSPEKNIATGVKLLGWIDQQLDSRIEREERVKFILAAYNIGYGHVEDAIRLAEKYGRNPYRWDDNVAYFLSRKNKPQYYKDPVVRNGYCKGSLATNYVNEVLSRYDHYRNFIGLSGNVTAGKSR